MRHNGFFPQVQMDLVIDLSVQVGPVLRFKGPCVKSKTWLLYIL